jgi:multiple sugar transport system ATP-binding protein
MTLLDAMLHWADGGDEVRLGSLVVKLPDGHVERSSRAPVEIKLGIRPEDVVLDEGFPATVKLVEPTGHESIVLFSLGNATITARVPSHIRLAAGEARQVGFRSGKLHIFDRATGLRMAGRPPSPALREKVHLASARGG